MNGPYKRFLLLMDDRYYPSAGTDSVVASYDTLEEAIEAASNGVYPKEAGAYLQGGAADYIEIFDCDNRSQVWERL